MRSHVDVAANANPRGARVKQADASGGRSNVDAITKEGED